MIPSDGREDSSGGFTSQEFHFGDFTLDQSRYRLQRGTRLLRLEKLPMELLILLVQRRGELVSRDDIAGCLWGKDVFLDVDHSINTAIRKIRVVLRDDPEKPRFVETVVGKGYRFAAPVTCNNGDSNPQVQPPPLVQAPAVPAVPSVKERVLSLRIETLPRRVYRFVGAVTGRPGNGTEPTATTEVTPDAAEKPARQSWIGARLVTVSLLGLTVAATLLLALNVRGMRDQLFTRHTNPAVRAIAVLPLTNLSGDPEQDYFAEGMTEALITELGKISALRVISRQSVVQYKGSKKGLSEIARELNVDAVLEGTVERAGDQVRVIARLDQVSPEGQLWSNQYNRDIRDLLRLQDEIARAVTDEIQVKLKPQEHARLASFRPVDPEAQDDYFRALHFRNEWEESYTSEEDLVTAINYFRQAVEKDSNYALAYAGMADTYIDLGNPQGGNYAPKETLPLAKAAATRAVEVDPLLGEAHFALAQTLELYDWNWSEAERQYKLALELSPNYAPAHLEYGRFLQALGRNDEAMKRMAYAVELNPMDLQTRFVVGIVTYAARQYDSAISQLKELNTSQPGLGDFGLGWCYREKKMYPEAIAVLQRVLVDTRGPLPLATLASVYGLAGRKREAMKLIDELKERSRKHHISDSLFAEAYLGLGEQDEAMACLERAYEEHDQWMVYIKSYPGWDALRSEARFQALVRRMNFPQ
jgi:TolB-like protein/DNA-binding winged helix-turn-helix (wHTH) protein/Tfp pilus assembly protein PilF